MPPETHVTYTSATLWYTDNDNTTFFVDTNRTRDGSHLTSAKIFSASSDFPCSGGGRSGGSSGSPPPPPLPPFFPLPPFPPLPPLPLSSLPPLPLASFPCSNGPMRR